MDETTESRPIRALQLTPRQIRLRYWTLILLAIIGLMIVIGVTHPFFHMTPPEALRHPAPGPLSRELATLRRAFATKLLLIGIYWAVCVSLTLVLPILAWLYAREIQVQELLARRDIVREVTGKKIRGTKPDPGDSSERQARAE